MNNVDKINLRQKSLEAVSLLMISKFSTSQNGTNNSLRWGRRCDIPLPDQGIVKFFGKLGFTHIGGVIDQFPYWAGRFIIVDHLEQTS